jgi:hypothetical protein
VAAWAIALLPVQKWLGAGVLRIIWATLVVVTPAIVGLIVRAAAPTVRGNAVMSALRGYPTTVGFRDPAVLALGSVLAKAPVLQAMQGMQPAPIPPNFPEPLPPDPNKEPDPADSPPDVPALSPIDFPPPGVPEPIPDGERGGGP